MVVGYPSTFLPRIVMLQRGQSWVYHCSARRVDEHGFREDACMPRRQQVVEAGSMRGRTNVLLVGAQRYGAVI